MYTAAEEPLSYIQDQWTLPLKLNVIREQYEKSSTLRTTELSPVIIQLLNWIYAANDTLAFIMTHDDEIPIATVVDVTEALRRIYQHLDILHRNNIAVSQHSTNKSALQCYYLARALCDVSTLWATSETLFAKHVFMLETYLSAVMFGLKACARREYLLQLQKGNIQPISNSQIQTALATVDNLVKKKEKLRQSFNRKSDTEFSCFSQEVELYTLTVKCLTDYIANNKYTWQPIVVLTILC